VATPPPPLLVLLGKLLQQQQRQGETRRNVEHDLTSRSIVLAVFVQEVAMEVVVVVAVAVGVDVKGIIIKASHSQAFTVEWGSSSSSIS
jgi:hypothetical protein